jgi:DivIVA domain-containing protein
MPFSPDEIEIKEFVPTLRGYGREEVRAYLRSVSEDVRRLEEQLEMAKSVAQLEKPRQATTVTAVEAQLVNPWSLTEPDSVQFMASHASASAPTPSVASSVLTAADAGLVVGLKEALTELTQAIARLSNQGLLGSQASVVRELFDHPSESALEFDIAEKTGSKKLASIAPNFASDTKPEPPFVRAEPQRIANSGLPKTAAVSWDGEDRRRPTRPWKSTEAVQMTPAIHTETEMIEGANPCSLLTAAQANSAPMAIFDTSRLTSRVEQNQNLIRTFLSGALGRTRKTVESSPKDPSGYESRLESSVQSTIESTSKSSFALSPGKQTATHAQAEVDNVIAFKRAAS